MAMIRIAEREATTLWEGDVIVLGAGWAGLTAALEAAARGMDACILEPGPTLGREVSAEWRVDVPDGLVGRRVVELCRDHGVPSDGALDVVTATLAFDRIVDEAGVFALVRVLPARALQDEEGLLTGVEVVGRSGRQAVRAPVVIDATVGRSFTRRGLDLDFPTVWAAERRLYLRGVTVQDASEPDVPATLGVEGGSVRLEPAAWAGEALLAYRVLLCVDATRQVILGATLATGTALVEHLRAHDPAFADATLVDVAPEPTLIDDATLPEAEGLAGSGLFPVPPREVLTDETRGVESLVTRIQGRAEFAPLPAQEDVDTAEVLESAELAACAEQDLETCTLPERVAVLHDPVDVIVAGCGTGAAFAALAAAEEGASVVALGPATLPAGKAEIADVFPGHTVFGVIRREGTVQTVVTAAGDGYHAFPAKVAVDATGDGDLAAAAGAAFTLGREGDGYPHPYSYTPALVTGGELSRDDIDVGRLRLWDSGCFSPRQHYCSLAPVLGVREGRLVRGALRVGFDDFMQGRTYPDTVMGVTAQYDGHAFDYAEESEWARRHVVMFGLWRHACSGEIPFRAICPEGLDNVLIAGRALSVDHDLSPLVGLPRDAQKLGEVCGVAAALSARTLVPPARLDVEQLQALLRRRGLLPEDPPEAAPDGTPEALLGLLPTDQCGTAMWRLSLLPAERAPDWEACLAAQYDPGQRFCLAVAAAMGGSCPPAVRDLLDAAVRQRVDAPRLGHGAPPACVTAALALAEAGRNDAAEQAAALLEADQLDGHALGLVLLALGMFRNPRTTGPVRAMLKRSEDETFRRQRLQHPLEQPAVAGAGVILRAIRTLHTLGCREEDARLRPYLNHENLLLRRHARRVAAE